MNSQKTMFAVAIVWLVVVAVAFLGWVMNIVKLVQADVFSGLEVARAISIFLAPVGAILGWF